MLFNLSFILIESSSQFPRWALRAMAEAEVAREATKVRQTPDQATR